MHVAIIMPTYNVERYLAETLDSVIAQTHSDWELLIVDDGSRDETVRVAQDYAQRDARIRVMTQANQGGAAARDNGFREVSSQTQAVMFFDHDDRMHPNSLALLTQALEEHPESPAAYGLASYMDAQGQPYRVGHYERFLRRRRRLHENRLVRMAPNEPATFEALLVNNWIPIGGILMRQEAKRIAGAFDAATAYAHDWDFWLRLSLQGPIAFVDEPVYDYRIHPASMSNNTSKLHSSELAVREKFIRAPEVPFDRRKQALQVAQLVMAEQLRRKKWKSFLRMISGRFAEGKQLLKTGLDNYQRFQSASLTTEG